VSVVLEGGRWVARPVRQASDRAMERRLLRATVPGALVVLVALVVAVGPWVLAVVLGGTVPLWLVLLWLRRDLRLECDKERLTLHVRRKHWELARRGAGHVVVANVQTPLGVPATRWIWRDASDSAVGPVLGGAGWDANDLRRLCAELDLDVREDPELLSLAELEERYPGSVPRSALRPGRIVALIVAIATVAAIVVAVVGHLVAG
jgi:hypothetical protein